MSKKTFKQYLTEEEASKQALATAKAIVGGKRQEVRADDPEFEKLEDLMDSVAKQIAIQTVKTAVGPWTISVFKAAGKTFARIIAPLSAKMKPLFVVEGEIHEIEKIIKKDYLGGKQDLPTKPTGTAAIKKLPGDNPWEYYVSRGGDIQVIFLLDPSNGRVIAKMELEVAGKDRLARDNRFPVDAFIVETITTHEDYRGMGVATELYKFALTPPPHGLGYTLLAGNIQTPGGQKNWASLFKKAESGDLPGVEITGWIRVKSDPGEIYDDEMEYYEQLFGEIGVSYLGEVQDDMYFQIPVSLAKNEKKLETLMDRAKIKIYANDPYAELPYYAGLMAKHRGI